MNLNLFSTWLSYWHQQLTRENKKVLLLLDNFKGHKVNQNDYPLITFQFLPPSSTSLTQPLDGGIIAAFKSKYFKMFIKYIISQIDCGHISDLIKQITILDAINWINCSRKDISRFKFGTAFGLSSKPARSTINH